MAGKGPRLVGLARRANELLREGDCVPVLLKKLLMTPQEMADYQEVFLEWQLWRRRLPPYHELEPGVRVVLVDGTPGDGTIAWEVVVTHVAKGPYDNLDEAFTLIKPLAAGSNVDRGVFVHHPYSAEAAVPGHLLAWTFEPVRAIGAPRRPEHVVSRSGWGRVDALTIGGATTASSTRSRSRGGGQGRLQDPLLRGLVEARAMKYVRQWLRRRGWSEEDIRDTSGSKPYDYEVGPVDSPEFRVEVKGAQGPAGSVVVTAGEVEAARNDGVRTVLAIVYDIEASLAPDGSWTVRGGRLWRDDDWQPQDSQLTAISYTYTPNKTSILPS